MPDMRLSPTLAVRREQVAIREVQVVVGSEHPKIAIRLNNIAGVLQDQGKLEEALPSHQQS